MQVQTLTDEKENIKKELVLAKEKNHYLECIVNSVSADNTKDGIDLEISRLSKHIATLEMKEINERQKSEYLSNQKDLLQTQVVNIEERNCELEEKSDILSKTNLELQKTERELREKLLTCVSQDSFEQLSNEIKQSKELEIYLKGENEKLKEISGICQIQIQDMENRKEKSTIEIESFKHQILDLQTQSDEKALIGRLHQTILSLQMKENDLTNENKTLISKINKIDALMMKSNKKKDDVEHSFLKMRNQYSAKIASLLQVIQDLRRQYSGAIPLSKQEKLSQSLIAVNSERQKVNKNLKEAELKLYEMEIKSEELSIKQQGMDEMILALKNNSTIQQALEWQNKLETIRIEELHARRSNEQLKKEVEFLKENLKHKEILAKSCCAAGKLY